jgi:hypothetical protein
VLVLRRIPVLAASVGFLALPVHAQTSSPPPIYPAADKPSAPASAGATTPAAPAKAEAAPAKPAGAPAATPAGAPGAPASDSRPATAPSSAAAPAGGNAAPRATGSLPRAAAAPAKPAGPPPSPAQVKKARELWYRGVDAFRNGRYEEARQAFAECYALMPKSDVLRNLSISEIQSGHYVAASRHLAQLLSGTDLPPDVREEATRRLAQAEAQVGKLNVTVDVPGAVVNIDGSPIGRSPLGGSWYIEPGQHEVSVTKPGYPDETRQIYALAGVAIPVTVSLESLRREQERDANAAQLMGTQEGETPRDRGISTGSTITLITTGSLAAAGFIAGIVFTVASNRHDSNADALGEHLSDPNSCGAGTEVLPDCQRLWQEQTDAQNDRKRATISFIGFGVASAATLGYALYLLLDSDDEHAKPKVSSSFDSLQPGVALSPAGATFSLQGQF